MFLHTVDILIFLCFRQVDLYFKNVAFLFWRISGVGALGRVCDEFDRTIGFVLVRTCMAAAGCDMEDVRTDPGKTLC